MEITSAYEIAVANLAVALSEDAVSTEQRAEIATAVGGDVDRLIDVVNIFIVHNNSKMYEGKITAAKAKSTVKAEYNAIGLGEVMKYYFLEKPIEVFYDRDTFSKSAPTEKVERIKEIFKRNLSCPNDRIRVGVDSYALRLLYHFGLIAEDLEFTKKLMIQINSYSTDHKEAAILPPAIVTEL